MTMKKYISTTLFLLFLLPLLLTGGCKKKKSPPPIRQEKVSAPPKKVQETPAAAPAPQTKYYVVTGSFLEPGNARRFEEMMQQDGFAPVELPGEAGFHRVAVISFTDEVEARQKLAEIRHAYGDAWLLIVKE